MPHHRSLGHDTLGAVVPYSWRARASTPQWALQQSLPCTQRSREPLWAAGAEARLAEGSQQGQGSWRGDLGVHSAGFSCRKHGLLFRSILKPWL